MPFEYLFNPCVFQRLELNALLREFVDQVEPPSDFQKREALARIAANEVQGDIARS
jgi:hypothetical protein